MRGIAVCGQHTPTVAFCTQPCLTHQPGNALACDASSSITHLGMQAWAAVSALMNAKSLLKLFGELGIFSLASTDRTLAPGIQAAFRDSEHSAHDDNGKFLLVLFNTLIFHLDSREKMARASDKSLQSLDVPEEQMYYCKWRSPGGSLPAGNDPAKPFHALEFDS